MTRALEPEHAALQADFERRLFESAQADSPPQGATERAWLQFAAAAGTLLPLAAAPTPVSWFRGARAQALKWTLIGAIGGGSLVAVWLRPAPAPLATRDVPLAAVPLAAVPLAAVPLAAVPLAAVPLAAVPLAAVPLAAVPLAAVPAAEAPSANSPAVGAPARVSEQLVSAGTPRASARRGRLLRPAAAPNAGAAAHQSSPAESLLAREVAALDAARSALAVGANASALQQIEQYHRDFPAGELSSEAEVVAIEALAAQGDRSAARRAAQAFLARHPHDPHLARVRELER